MEHQQQQLMVMVGILYLTHSGLLDGLNVFAGLSSIDQNATLGDKDSEAYGATYAIGGATIGYQHSKEDNVGAAVHIMKTMLMEYHIA